MILKIVSYPDINLLTKTTLISHIDDNVLAALDAMAAIMYVSGGIGLAANQVALQQRMCVIDISDEKNNLLKLINPVIVSSDGEVSSTEGCLSFDGITVTVKRPQNVVVHALNIKGENISIEASGLLATCLSHELDHLDGKTFLDKLGKTTKQLALIALSKAKRASNLTLSKKAIETI